MNKKTLGLLLMLPMIIFFIGVFVTLLLKAPLIFGGTILIVLVIFSFIAGIEYFSFGDDAWKDL